VLEHLQAHDFSARADGHFDPIAMKQAIGFARGNECILHLAVFKNQKAKSLGIFVDPTLES
jgi:hypothetical protein